MPDVWYVTRRGGGRYMGRHRTLEDATAYAETGMTEHGWTDVEIVKDVLTRTTETVWRDGRHIEGER